MQFPLLLCIAFAAVALATSNITCNVAQNTGDGAVGLIYNAACPADHPYCTGSGLCSECVKSKDSTCDCPANYICVQSQFNIIRNADFCVPEPLTMINRACTTSNDCNVGMINQITKQNTTAFYGVCASSVCRYCDARTVGIINCVQGQVPAGNNPNAYGSKSAPLVCTTNLDNWNSNTRTLNPPLPTNLFSYERAEYLASSAAPTPSNAAPSASPSKGSPPSPKPSKNPSTTTSDASYIYGAMLMLAALCCIVM